MVVSGWSRSFWAKTPMQWFELGAAFNLDRALSGHPEWSNRLVPPSGFSALRLCSPQDRACLEGSEFTSGPWGHWTRLCARD
jgi:hypothetical protein